MKSIQDLLQIQGKIYSTNASSSTSTPNGKALSVNASGDVKILIDSVGCSGSNCPTICSEWK